MEEQINKYIKQCHCSYDQAKIRVEYFNKLKKEMEEASICPECSEKSLYIENTDIPESLDGWVECETCGFTDDLDEYEALSNGYDFDVVLWFSIDIDKLGIDEVEKEVGLSWTEFVDKENQDLIQTA